MHGFSCRLKMRGSACCSVWNAAADWEKHQRCRRIFCNSDLTFDPIATGASARDKWMNASREPTNPSNSSLRASTRPRKNSYPASDDHCNRSPNRFSHLNSSNVQRQRQNMSARRCISSCFSFPSFFQPHSLNIHPRRT